MMLLVEIIIALFFNGLAMSPHVSCVTALRLVPLRWMHCTGLRMLDDLELE
jgi:hypothetical protein